ncbi:hypothetical protein [Burkholderia anthina]|uniref:hypothetical protein n=1 Tax=Burkholderia anthina TaxID=179879 RepID=UPI001AA04D72|nr:hypothetical protein [Burkholderia anthina]QTD88120.1 hypothetical protein J4G50_09705 [Burkholderia anthina]
MHFVAVLVKFFDECADDRRSNRIAAKPFSHSRFIKKDDGRFATDRYRALTRRERGAHGGSSGCTSIDAAHPRFAASCGKRRQRARSPPRSRLPVTVSDKGQ